MQLCLPTNQVERALIAVSRLEVVYVIFFVLMTTDSAALSAFLASIETNYRGWSTFFCVKRRMIGVGVADTNEVVTKLYSVNSQGKINNH